MPSDQPISAIRLMIIMILASPAEMLTGIYLYVCVRIQRRVQMPFAVIGFNFHGAFMDQKGD